MLKEFKEFITKRSVLDLAVGVMIGAAFSKIVSSFVNDIAMPIFGVILGGRNFSELSITIGEATIKYGSFLQNVLDFLIIALTLFLVIKFVNKFNEQNKKLKKTLKKDSKKQEKE